MNIFSRTLTATGIALIGFQAAANVDMSVPQQNSEHISVSDHHIFNTETLVSGATILTRDFSRRMATASIYNNALTPSTAYSVWWAIFNQPQHCV
jgi:hypothetical protein